ncbi:hypothetical protein CPC08DRAFT_712174 [Agrocybe pediades]|nr:hypothetical protein CPC08DRAFT_712174 [Agrocybe pediades]
MSERVHALPVELIYKVFLFASVDKASIPVLLLVCKSSYAWLVPILYHSIEFTTSDQISKFLHSLDTDAGPLDSPFPFVRNLYIGETPSNVGDLSYASTNWPVTTLSRLLWMSRSLERLTIVNLDQNEWHKLDHTIPSSVEYLTMGPVHGSFRPQDMKQKLSLKHFTSISTYMRDDEIQDIICYPSMRTFRRILEASTMAPQWAVEQVGCISQSEHLDNMEILLFGRHEYTVLVAEVIQEQLKSITQDPRAIITRDGRTWNAIVYGEYQRSKFAFQRLLVE